MNDKFLLEPLKIPKECFLYDAILWLAFYKYPLNTFSIKDYGDVIEFPKKAVYRCANIFKHHLHTFFSTEFCKEYNLPDYHSNKEEIKNAKLAQNEMLRSEKMRELQIQIENFTRRFLPDARIEDFTQIIEEKMINIERIMKNIIENIETSLFEKRNSKPTYHYFEEKLEELLELYKAKLFALLKEGKIKAKAIRMTSNDFYILDKFFIAFKAGTRCVRPDSKWYFRNFEEIATSEWKLQNIDWKNGFLKCKDYEYAQIIISTNDLFREVPEPFGAMREINFVSNSYILSPSNTKKNANSKGRKQEYDWAEFQKEVLDRFIKGKLPNNQTTLIYDMQIWCKSKWGKAPSETNIKEKIKPFYMLKAEKEKI